MQYDGSVWINAKIDTDGMVKGFERIKDGAGDVASTVKKVGTVIEDAFAVAGNSTAVKKACDSLGDLTKSFADLGKQLEEEKKKLATLKEDYAYLSEQLDPLKNPGGAGFNMDLDTYLDYTEALKALPAEIAKQEAVVEKYENQWRRSSQAIEQAVTKVTETVTRELDKQADAAEKAAERKEDAAEKEIEANNRIAESQMDEATGSVSAGFEKASKSAGTFSTRLKSIAAAAFVFNVVRKGLSSIVSYFGKALMANNQFANAVNSLKFSLQVAFQPIYEAILPALLKLVQWLNYAVQAVGRFFAALAGKDYSEMRKNAQALNNAMNGTSDAMQDAADSTNDASDSIDKVGDSLKDTNKKAKEAEKSLAGFDEINRMIKEDAEDLTDTLDNLNKDDNFDYTENIDPGNANNTIESPTFEEFKFPEEWAAAIDQLAMRVHDIFFEWEDLNAEVITQKLLTALGAIAGGLIGFSLLGIKGALFGIAIGAVLSILLSTIIFDGDGKLSSREIAKLLVSALSTIAGGLIGFAVGGPGGAVIGALIGLGVSFAINSFDFEKYGSSPFANFLEKLLPILNIAASGLLGFVIGGPGGAAIGLTISLALTFLAKSASFEGVEISFESLMQRVSQLSEKAKKSVENLFIKPTDNNFSTMISNLRAGLDNFVSMFTDKQGYMANRAETMLYHPLSEMSDSLTFQQISDTERASNSIINVLKRLHHEIGLVYITPTGLEFTNLAVNISQAMTGASNDTVQAWIKIPQWFYNNVRKPIIDGINELASAVGSGLMKTLESITNAISNAVENAISTISRLADSIRSLKSERTSTSSTYSAASYSVMSAYSATPEIPHLAKGAVIPPNQKFLAVLGDQRSGTNIEAPLETIQEAVAMVMEDMIQSNLAGHEATVSVLQQILEAVLGIELDGEAISNAVNNYNRKMAVVKGG